jgi:hypothetical protein
MGKTSSESDSVGDYHRYTGSPMSSNPLLGLIERFASRLRFPQLFYLTAGLFLLDLVIPDLLPFADEILLGLLTLLLGNLRTQKGAEEEQPPMKDVIPPGTKK